jgi:hypothetical protein
MATRERLSAALRGIVKVMIERKSTILILYHESHNLERRSLRVILRASANSLPISNAWWRKPIKSVGFLP